MPPVLVAQLPVAQLPVAPGLVAPGLVAPGLVAPSAGPRSNESAAGRSSEVTSAAAERLKLGAAPDGWAPANAVSSPA